MKAWYSKEMKKILYKVLMCTWGSSKKRLER